MCVCVPKYVFAAPCPRRTPKRMAMGREVASKYLELVGRVSISSCMSAAEATSRLASALACISNKGHLDVTLLP